MHKLKVQAAFKITFLKNEEKKALESVKGFEADGHKKIDDTGYSKEGVRTITLVGQSIIG